MHHQRRSHGCGFISTKGDARVHMRGRNCLDNVKLLHMSAWTGEPVWAGEGVLLSNVPGSSAMPATAKTQASRACSGHAVRCCLGMTVPGPSGSILEVLREPISAGSCTCKARILDFRAISQLQGALITKPKGAHGPQVWPHPHFRGFMGAFPQLFTEIRGWMEA